MSTFSLFNSFPPEIHALILDACPKNDRVCLRLTCKYLYNISPQKDTISLDNIDSNERLCAGGIIKTILTKRGGPNCSLNYQLCHERYLSVVNSSRALDGKAPIQKPLCKQNRYNYHCRCCINGGKQKLYQRLRTWVPKGLNYCGECKMYTRRKKSHKGKCYHGSPKPNPRNQGSLWKHHPRRGGFHSKLWKKWFNNAAWNRLEKRLRSSTPRKSNERYDLRTLKPTDVNTIKMRCN